MYNTLTIPLQKYGTVVVTHRAYPNPGYLRDHVRHHFDAAFPAGPERVISVRVAGPPHPTSWWQHLRQAVAPVWSVPVRWAVRRNIPGAKTIREYGRSHPVRVIRDTARVQVTARCVFPGAQRPDPAHDFLNVAVYTPPVFPTALGEPSVYRETTIDHDTITPPVVEFADLTVNTPPWGGFRRVDGDA